MDHERYRELLQLAISDEISAGEMSTLRDHLTECDTCRAEFHELRQLMTVLGEGGTAEPSEQMLWQTRRRLSETIRQESPAQPALPRTTQDVAPMVSGPLAERGSSLSPGGLVRGWMDWMRGYRLAFSGATAIAIGVFIGYVSFGGGTVEQATTSAPPGANNYEALGRPDIANVRFVGTSAPSGEIEIHYDLVRPVRLRAGLDDARMQRMLAYALLNEENTGVRLQAVNAFATAASRTGDGDVKRALIEALTTDPNAGVRRESFRVLQQLTFDDDIKNACLYVLTNDRNPGMRVAAINLLARATQEGDLAGGEIYNTLRTQLGDDDLLRAKTTAFIQEDNGNE